MCLEVRPPEILGLLLEHLVCGEPWARRRMPQQNQDWRLVSTERIRISQTACLT